MTTSATVAALAPAHTPRLAGLLGSGMLDWPGRIAATAFVAGCTMRCPYCHNPELVSCRKAGALSLAELLERVDAKRGWIDGVVVTGGEPTADPGLLGMLEALRARAVPVKLDTNGSRPEVLREVLDRRLAEFIALDVKAAPARYDRVSGLDGAWELVRESVAAVITSGVEHEFRTTCYPLAVGPSDFTEIAGALCGGRRLALQQFRPSRTLDPAAASVAPYAGDVLRKAAVRCSVFLPTIVRGV